MDVGKWASQAEMPPLHRQHKRESVREAASSYFPMPSPTTDSSLRDAGSHAITNEDDGVSYQNETSSITLLSLLYRTGILKGAGMH